MSTLLFFIRGGPIQDTRHHFSRGPHGIMHIKNLWAHAYYTTTFTRWAHVGFAKSLGLFAHGFYQLYRDLCTALCVSKTAESWTNKFNLMFTPLADIGVQSVHRWRHWWQLARLRRGRVYAKWEYAVGRTFVRSGKAERMKVQKGASYA
jgi:hypothetical protein